MLPQKSSALGFAVLLTTVTTVKPLDSIFVSPILAQAAPTSFPVPTSVPSGTTVQIDGSSSMAAINQALKQRFETQFSGSKINVNYSGTPPALQAVRDGILDLAAIGRPLTQAERDQGLVPVSMGRGKIALIVSPDNPFKGSITVPQFVKIVRGDITDWSELGGSPGKIRFVDRPELSDTRAAFRNYSVFIRSPFEPGKTATRSPEDSTQAVAQQLGKDGLSFAPANQVLNQSNLRIVPMHNTLPTDPRYPFSQPFYYVHKPNPAAGAAAFLGYASSDSGQKTAQTTEINPASLALDSTALLAAGSVAASSLNAGSGSGASPSPTGAASPGATSGTTSPTATGGTADGSQTVGAVPPPTEQTESGIPGWLWWLLPLGIGALLLAWFLRRRSAPPAEPPTTVTPPPAEPPTAVTPPPPPPLMTPAESDGSLASRTGSVISSDRASIADSPTIPPAAIGGAALAGAGAASAIGSGQTQPPVEPPAAEVPPVEPPIAEIPPVEASVPVPDRPLVEIREMPPIEVPSAEIEPPEAPPELDLPNGAILGAAGLGAAGAAAWMSRTRSEDVPESEPLTSLDAIEPIDEVEDAPLDQPPIELDVDDAPTVVDELTPIDPATDATYTQLDLDRELGTPANAERGASIETGESAIVEPTPDLNLTQGVIPGIAAVGGAAGLAALSNSEPNRSELPTIEPQIEDTETLDSTPEPSPEPSLSELSSELSMIESSSDPILDESVEPIAAATPIEPSSDSALIEPIGSNSDESVEDPTLIQGAIPGLAAFGGAAALGIAGMAATGEDEPPNAERSVEPSSEPASVPEFSEIDAGTDLETDEFPSIAAEEPDTISEEPPAVSESQPSLVEAAIPGVAAVGGLAAGLVGDRENTAQTQVEAARFDVGQNLSSESLASIDQGLPDLPDGYGESQIVLMPRDPQWAYAYWDVSNEHKSELRSQGGQTLCLRLYDVTDIDLGYQNAHSLQQFTCDELARNWYLPIPVSDRDYLVEIGYLTSDGRWLTLARSLPVRIPPVYPATWQEDQFLTIDWGTALSGQTFVTLEPPTESGLVVAPNGMYDQIFDLAQGAELQRIAGSIFGSMQQVPTESISAYRFPSGIGLPTASGISGMSGVGLSGEAVPIRPRRFWLVADAELIIYGATEPDATLTIAGETIPLSPDGTFRIQLSFQDGQLDYPILAVANDGEQTRSIHLKFTRETPSRNTNTKDAAIDEWQS